VDSNGVLHEVEIAWLSDAPDLGLENRGVSFRDVRDLQLADGQACFTTDDRSAVSWALSEPVSGPGLVVSVDAEVDKVSPVKVSILAEGVDKFAAANHDGHELRPGRPPRLETVAPSSVRELQLNGWARDVGVCLSGLQVGQITPAG
jgi:hypothetical protein